MKYLVSNIKYLISLEDIEAYRKSKNLPNSVSDRKIKKEIQKSLPLWPIVKIHGNYKKNLEKALDKAVFDLTGYHTKSFDKAKFYKCQAYDETFRVCLVAEKYYSNQTLCVDLLGETEPFATITKNIPNGCAGNTFAYVDVKNYPWAQKFLKDNELATNTGIVNDGYPLYNFNIEKF